MADRGQPPIFGQHLWLHEDGSIRTSRGDELATRLRTKQRRVKAIRDAKAALEAEARERAQADGGPSGAGGGTPAVDPKAQRNFTEATPRS